MPSTDIQTTRIVRTQVTRRYIDASMLDVRVMHGIVYMRGELACLRSHPEVNLEHEKDVITHILRSRPEIRDVIWELNAI